MVDTEEFLWGFSFMSVFLYLIGAMMKAIRLALQIPLYPSPQCPWVTDVIMVDHHIHKTSTTEEEENEALHNSNGKNAPHIKLRRRPARLVVPDYCPSMELTEVENVELEIKGRDFCLVSKKGRREKMEDRYKVITDISGDPSQAFFAVIDGHGGHAAADYVAENLGKNILKTLENLTEENKHGVEVEQAICGGYFQTDREFLSQGVGSGACAASVLLRNGKLHTANVGDCRVVLSRRGLATRLTHDHRPTRQDERSRIENSGGIVESHNGVWRVQGSLAVSRAIGDLHLKDWIISEPEIEELHLTSDCDFLIVATDGLWDKVSEQEAVDVVLGKEVTIESCKKLVDICCSRGNRDDVTVIVINLQKFVVAAGSC